MSETKDPAIKLFGKTIPLQEIAAGSGFDGENECEPCCAHDEDGDDDELEVVEKDALAVDCAVHKGDARANENPKTPSIDNESATLKSSRTEDEQSDTGVSEEKTLKKPDKIIPCPRCNSMDTKFCYYNNYNVNQPRHFCKNCQRYWTAGGTMRNVPVGAGRRKNKNSVSQCQHIAGSENFPISQPNNIPNGIHQPTLKQNGSVLTFCSDSPLCDSMATVLSLTEKNMMNNTRNGFHRPEELQIPVPYEGSENAVNKLSSSSIIVSNSNGMQESPPSMQSFQGYPHQIPCFPGAPWPYPWNPAQWNPSIPPPGYCPPGYPMPFYPPATYWGWNVPLMPHPSPANHQYSNTGPTSPLGKHSREEEDELVQPNNSVPEEEPSKQSTSSEKCLWIPKTLRIDNLGEAAKSSIWDTLGIKNEMADPIGGRGLFKAFQSKKPEKNHMADTSSVLQANPAALCRSLNFQEST